MSAIWWPAVSVAPIAAHHQRRAHEQAALREHAAGDRRADARQLAQHAPGPAHRCARRNRTADRRDAGACTRASRGTSATSEIAVATPQPTAPSCGMPNLPYMKIQLPMTFAREAEKADVHDRLGAPEALARVAQREECQQRRHAPAHRVHVADRDRQDVRRDADRRQHPVRPASSPVTSTTASASASHHDWRAVARHAARVVRAVGMRDARRHGHQQAETDEQEQMIVSRRRPRAPARSRAPSCPAITVSANDMPMMDRLLPSSGPREHTMARASAARRAVSGDRRHGCFDRPLL